MRACFEGRLEVGGELTVRIRVWRRGNKLRGGEFMEVDSGD